MPKALIASVIRAARPGGSKPPTSLGVRPKLAKRGRGSLQPFCASASDQTSETLILHRENFLQLGTPCEIIAKAMGLSFEEVAQVLRNSLTASSVVSV